MYLIMYFNFLIVKGVPPTRYSVPCVLFWNLPDDGKKKRPKRVVNDNRIHKVLRAVLALKVNTDNE
jgi:hypothetical protein